MFVSVVSQGLTGEFGVAGLDLYINGGLVSAVAYSPTSTAFTGNVSGIVPPGATYEVQSTSGNISSWVETY